MNFSAEKSRNNDILLCFALHSYMSHVTIIFIALLTQPQSIEALITTLSIYLGYPKADTFSCDEIFLSFNPHRHTDLFIQSGDREGRHKVNMAIPFYVRL